MTTRAAMAAASAAAAAAVNNNTRAQQQQQQQQRQPIYFSSSASANGLTSAGMTSQAHSLMAGSSSHDLTSSAAMSGAGGSNDISSSSNSNNSSCTRSSFILSSPPRMLPLPLSGVRRRLYHQLDADPTTVLPPIALRTRARAQSSQSAAAAAAAGAPSRQSAANAMSLSQQAVHQAASAATAAFAASAAAATFPAQPLSELRPLSEEIVADDAAASPLFASGPASSGTTLSAEDHSVYFVAPEAGLVANKPFSLELRGQLHCHHPPSRPGRHHLAAAASASAMATTTRLLFKVATKVTGRPMEKRTNTYEPIEEVWVALEPVYAPPPNFEIEARAAGRAKTRATSRKKGGGRRAASSSRDRTDSDDDAAADPPETASDMMVFAAAAVASSSASSQPELPELDYLGRSTTPVSSSASSLGASPVKQIKLNSRHNGRDRTIGSRPVVVDAPPLAQTDARSAGSVQEVLAKMHICITAVEIGGRKGIHQRVSTKGGGCNSRPRQTYMLIQSGFGYQIQLPLLPPGFTLEVSSLLLRSWEQAVTLLAVVDSPNKFVTPYPHPPPGRVRSKNGSRSSSAAANAGAASRNRRGQARKQSRDDRTDSDDGDESDNEDDSDDSLPPADEADTSAQPNLAAPNALSPLASMRQVAKKGKKRSRSPFAVPQRYGRSLSALLAATSVAQRANSDGPASCNQLTSPEPLRPLPFELSSSKPVRDRARSKKKAKTSSTSAGAVSGAAASSAAAASTSASQLASPPGHNSSGSSGNSGYGTFLPNVLFAPPPANYHNSQLQLGLPPLSGQHVMPPQLPPAQFSYHQLSLQQQQHAMLSAQQPPSPPQSSSSNGSQSHSNPSVADLMCTEEFPPPPPPLLPPMPASLGQSFQQQHGGGFTMSTLAPPSTPNQWRPAASVSPPRVPSQSSNSASPPRFALAGPGSITSSPVLASVVGPTNSGSNGLSVIGLVSPPHLPSHHRSFNFATPVNSSAALPVTATGSMSRSFALGSPSHQQHYMQQHTPSPQPPMLPLQQQLQQQQQYQQQYQQLQQYQQPQSLMTDVLSVHAHQSRGNGSPPRGGTSHNAMPSSSAAQPFVPPSLLLSPNRLAEHGTAAAAMMDSQQRERPPLSPARRVTAAEMFLRSPPPPQRALDAATQLQALASPASHPVPMPADREHEQTL